MKSDYYRYLAEFATGEAKSEAGEDARDACVEANKIAENDLAVTHPIRLATDTKFLRSLKTLEDSLFRDQRGVRQACGRSSGRGESCD